MGAGPGPVSGRAWRSAALALGVGLGFSRLLGLARDMFFAGLLGGGLAADIFLAAFRLPHFARRLLHEGAPALAFIPAFVREEAHGGRESALAFGRAAWLELVLAALLLSLAGAAAAGALARMLLPGLSGEAALLEMTAGFIRLGLFYLPLAAGAATGSALLMALGHYAAPACAPLVLNLGLLAAGGLALLAGHSGSAAAETLCLGLILGGLLQNAVQFMAARGLRVRLAGRVSLTAPANLGFLRAMPPAICGAAAHQLHMLAVTVAASFLHQGGISALYYAERLLELPVALVGVPLGMTGLAGFSALALAGEGRRLGHELKRMLALVFFLTLPAAAGLMAVAHPLVESLFQRGAFDAEAARLTGTALFFYAPALPALAAARPLLAALNAQGGQRATVAAVLLSLAGLLFCAPPLMRLMDIAGLALSLGLSSWLNFFLLGRSLLRRVPHAASEGFFPWKKCVIFTGMSLIMAAAVWALLRFLAGSPGWSARSGLALVIPLAALLYFALAALLRLPEFKDLIPRSRSI